MEGYTKAIKKVELAQVLTKRKDKRAYSRQQHIIAYLVAQRALLNLTPPGELYEYKHVALLQEGDVIVTDQGGLTVVSLRRNLKNDLLIHIDALASLEENEDEPIKVEANIGYYDCILVEKKDISSLDELNIEFETV